jgi:bifunctional DNase/RNase
MVEDDDSPHMAPVPCFIRGVFVILSSGGTVPLVVLRDGTGRMLPIFIGFPEAVSINSAYIGEVPPRPFTHDLFIETLTTFGITVKSLQIDAINDGVYYAQLVLSADHREERVDCRPSDGIALALRNGAPMYVDETVLESAGQAFGDLPPMIDIGIFLRK